LLGDEATIHARAEVLGLKLDDAQIVNPEMSPLREKYVEELYRLRQRRGVALSEARI
jgi:phosphotransacetylase